MKKYSAVPFLKAGLSCALILALLGLAGCAGTSSNIPMERRIDLIHAENNQGNFKSGPFVLGYSYTLTDDNIISGNSNMILAGQASYSGGFDSLDIRLLFLDQSGTVLQRKIIYSSGYRSNRTRGSKPAFQKTLRVPPGAASMTFTYSVTDRSTHR